MRRLPALLLATGLLMAPAPASACAPPHVYFGTGSTRLDAAARSVVRYAVGEFRRRRGVRLRLSAGTDGVGRDGANRQLARRRGEAVRAALVRRGVPAGLIEIRVQAPGGRAVSDGDRRVVVMDMIAAPMGCW